MKKIVALIMSVLFISSAMFLSGCSKNQGSKGENGKSFTKKELVVGLDASFPPMGFKNEKNEIVGFDIDLAKEVGKRLGVNVKFQPINWDMKLQELNNENIDCIWNGFTIKEEFKSKLLYSVPYMKNRQVLVAPIKSKATKKDDLKGKKIALQAGSSAEDALNKNEDLKKSVTVIDAEDNMLALQEMNAGGADAVLMDEVVASYLITVKNKDYKILDGSLAGEEYGIGFKRDASSLCAKVNKAFSDMRIDGTLEKISKDWFGKDVTTIIAD